MSERLFQFVVPADGVAVDFRKDVSRFEARPFGRRVEPHDVDRRFVVDASFLHRHSQEAGVQVLARLQSLHRVEYVGERNGETDSRVVPFDAGRLFLAGRRQRDDDAQHVPGQIDQRSAVIDRRDVRIGLNGLAPHAVDGADDADRNARFGAVVRFGPERSPTGRRGLLVGRLAAAA